MQDTGRQWRLRLSATLVAAIVAALPLALSVPAGGGQTGAPAKKPTDAATAVQTECGACHVVYPAQFLPARSWRAVMAGLANHFGEIATLDRATARQVQAYLEANAADTPNGEPAFLRGLRPTDAPLRITDTPLWRTIHPELLRPGVGTGPGNRSAAQCLNCHGRGGTGDGD